MNLDGWPFMIVNLHMKSMTMHLYVNSLHIIFVRKCFICFIAAFRAYDLEQTDIYHQ